MADFLLENVEAVYLMIVFTCAGLVGLACWWLKP